MFGVPLIEVTQKDFECEGLQYVIGVAPCQIGFLTSLPGARDFSLAWKDRSLEVCEGVNIYYLGKKDLILAKKNASRPQDLADIDELNRVDDI